MTSLILASLLGQARTASVTGELKLHEKFVSATLGNERTIRVWTPPGYATSRQKHAVFYMHDGQNLFDGLTSFIPNQEWMADEAATALINAKVIEPIIIVGIDNAGVDRANEYVPIKFKSGTMEGGGKADLYGKFLMDELMPFINRTYRTKTGPENTGLCGSSFGGIITMHLGLTHPKTFGRLGICSPSLWLNNGAFVDWAKSKAKTPGQKIWLDMGTKESDATLRQCQRLSQVFQSQGNTPGRDLIYYEEGFGQHNEAAWARRLPSILQFLFPAKR